MLVALVAVVAAVALAVLGNGGSLPDAEPDRLDAPLPTGRPVHRGDLENLRIAVTLRGYRMSDVDDVLDRVGAELAERDGRIAELEAALAGAQDAALGGRALGGPQQPQPYGHPQRPYDGPPQPYEAPPRPFAAPSQPFAAPPQPYAAPPEGYDDPPLGRPRFGGRPQGGGSAPGQGPSPSEGDRPDAWGRPGE